MHTYLLAALAAFSLTVSACGGDDSEVTPADLSRTNSGDMSAVTVPDGSTTPNPDGSTTPPGCTVPSDTCVTSPTTNAGFLNACTLTDVQHVDITPYFPAQGYTNCKLPTP